MSDKINACDDETYDFGFPVLFFLSKSVLPNLLAVLFSPVFSSWLSKYLVVYQPKIFY